MKIERFEDIEAWQLARELTRDVYRVTAGSRFARDYGLRDQIQRAAGSIMHNIAEGFDAGMNTEFIRFLGYALRSCTEVQSQLYIALDRQYLSEEEFKSLYGLAAQTRSKIGAFMRYLRDHPQPARKNRGPPNSEPRTPNAERRTS